MPPVSKKRIVTRTPLDELWTEDGQVAAVRGRALGADDLRALLRQGPVRFAVADVGKPLHWLPEGESYDFWKSELRPHLARPGPEGVFLEDFPGGYCYFACQWRLENGGIIVLLEISH